MRKLVTIQKIKKIFDIPNADRIVGAEILGWRCITQKSNNFKEGDLVVYFEIDSFIPECDEFEFLRPSSYKRHIDGSYGFRIKTIKLRGQIAQGLILPFEFINTELPWCHIGDEYMVSDWPKAGSKVFIEEGADITSLLGVRKFEQYIPPEMAELSEGHIPSWLTTDEIRIQLLEDLLRKYEGQAFYTTEKLDGTSTTYYINEDWELKACGRTHILMKNDDLDLWKLAIKYDLEKKMKSLPKRYAIQGELIGPGWQGNKYALEEIEFRVFSVADMETETFCGLEEMLQVCELLRLKTVPILDDIVIESNVDKMVDKAYGQSALNKNVNREGIVLRPHSTVYDNDFDVPHSRVSLKIINPKFLLKYDE